MNEFGAILTRQGDWVIVSIEDWDLANRYKWHTHRAGGRKGHAHPYATASIKRRSARMHRLITNAPKGMLVDHINRDSMDNRRENLRVTTNAVNMINSKDRDIFRNRLVSNLKSAIRIHGEGKYWSMASLIETFSKDMQAVKRWYW